MQIAIDEKDLAVPCPTGEAEMATLRFRLNRISRYILLRNSAGDISGGFNEDVYPFQGEDCFPLRHSDRFRCRVWNSLSERLVAGNPQCSAGGQLHYRCCPK